MLTFTDHSHPKSTDPEGMNSYLKDVNDMMLQFKSMMDLFDTTHFDEKTMRETVIKLEKTIPEGYQVPI